MCINALLNFSIRVFAPFSVTLCLLPLGFCRMCLYNETVTTAGAAPQTGPPLVPWDELWLCHISFVFSCLWVLCTFCKPRSQRHSTRGGCSPDLGLFPAAPPSLGAGKWWGEEGCAATLRPARRQPQVQSYQLLQFSP